MAYDPNDPRKSFEYDEFSRRPSIDPAPAGFTGLVIGAIVVLGALIAFLMFRSDTDTTTIGMNQPPATQQSPAAPPSAAPNNPANPTQPTPPQTPQTPPANNN
ncbi:MAG: hypothetical protein K2P86_06260 [Xanthobacteraceae bacterium]|jgi:hypothetical protein|nr:hypothetical protein [Xanthobacteraceae bacterium]